jgi:hypothetical protein
MVVPSGLADLARDRPLRTLKSVHPDDRGQQRRPHHLADSGSLPLLQGRKDSERAVHARQQVRDRHADALNVGWSGTGYRHQPRFALGDLVVAGAPGFGAVVAESADGQDDQSRIDLGQALLGKPEPVKDTGAEILHQHVGPDKQSLQGGLAGLLLEIEGHGLLVPIRAQEVGRLTVAVHRLGERRSPSPGVIAAIWVLHFDHLGAEVAQHHRGVWSSQGPGQVDDPQAVEGPGGFCQVRPRRGGNCRCHRTTFGLVTQCPSGLAN